MAGHGSGDKPNFRAFVFWASEIIFAIISGTFEAYVYHAYTDPGLDPTVSWGESIARAIITQVMIVLLTIAAVQIWTSDAHLLARIGGYVSVQAFAIAFAFVAFWMMRVAALSFQQTSELGVALQGAIPLPFVGDVSAQEGTLDIVAALSFFQVAVNIYAPVIVRDRKPKSIEQLREDAERKRLQGEISEQNLMGGISMLARLGRHVRDEVKGKVDEPPPAENSQPLDPGNLLHFPGQDAGASAENSQPITPAKRGASPKGGLPGTHWKAEQILGYIRETLHREEVGLEDVKRWLSEHHKAERANGENTLGISLAGGPYFMHAATARSEAKKKWPALPSASQRQVEVAD